MTNAPKPLTASAIKYLLILLELCKNETGARCMDIAGQLHVTKPSVHSMIGNLCSAGLAEKKKYGNVFLTPAGRAEAERYAGCCQQLSGRMQQSLGLNAEDARRAGFRDLVFIIKREHEALFRERIGDRMERFFNVEYVYQELTDIPAGCEVPEGRIMTPLPSPVVMTVSPAAFLPESRMG